MDLGSEVQFYRQFVVWQHKNQCTASIHTSVCIGIVRGQ